MTLWPVAGQAPLSMGFTKQEYWSGLLCPPPGDLPDQRIEPTSFMCTALVGEFFTISTTWEAQLAYIGCVLGRFSTVRLCDPMPGSSVHGILQARILEMFAIPFSRGSS